MKVKVIAMHTGEGQFPMFAKGTAVQVHGECSHYLHWYACEIEGQKTYVPEGYFKDGVLLRDYNPTELVQDVGDVLEVKAIVHAWLFAANADGVTGWIPAESVVSIDDWG